MKKFVVRDLPGGAEFLRQGIERERVRARVFVMQVQNEDQNDQTERLIVTTSKDLCLELGGWTVPMRSKFVALLETMYEIGREPQYVVDFSRSEKDEDRRRCGLVTRSSMGTAQVTYTLSPA